MDTEKNENQLNSLSDIDLINKHTLEPLKEEDVFTFKVQLCDNDVDRVGDKMSDKFLNEVADKVKGVAGLKDHDWSVENQVARLYDAQVVEDEENTTVLGERRKYVQGSAYTLAKNREMIDKINSGILKEVSISFNSEGDTCSICGKPMCKDGSDIGHCENGHVAGQSYDGQLCYNKIDNLMDILEWSLVSVPCQRRAGINKKSLEGGSSIMKKAELLIRQFMSSKSYEKAAPEDKEVLEEVTKKEDVELTEEDIQKLVEENGKLKTQVEELKEKVKEATEGREKDKIEAIVSKGLDELNPLTDKVKEMIMKEIPWDTLKLEDGQIPGMADIFDKVKEDYKGLFKESTKEEDKGCGDDDVETKEVETPTVENKEGAEENKDTEIKSKGLKPSGITFGVSTKSGKDAMANKKSMQPGIYFN